MIEFARPWLLTLLVVVVPIAWLRFKKGGVPAVLRHPNLDLMENISPSLKVVLHRQLPWLSIVALVLLILASAGPRIPHLQEDVDGEGIDIILALDISGSMQALDFEPLNRLEAAKEVIAEFILKHFAAGQVGNILQKLQINFGFHLPDLLAEQGIVHGKRHKPFPTNGDGINTHPQSIGKIGGSFRLQGWNIVHAISQQDNCSARRGGVFQPVYSRGQTKTNGGAIIDEANFHSIEKTVQNRVVQRQGTLGISLGSKNNQTNAVIGTSQNKFSNNFLGCFQAVKRLKIECLHTATDIKGKDNVGLVLFSDHVEKVIRPGKGRKHVMRLIRELLTLKATGTGTNLNEPLQAISRILKRKATIFLVSDFWTGDFKKSLSILARRHDVVAIRVRDPLEKDLPFAGLVRWVDTETGTEALVDISDTRTRDAIFGNQNRIDAALDKQFLSFGVDLIDVDVSQPYVFPLRNFFQGRVGRGRRKVVR